MLKRGEIKQTKSEMKFKSRENIIVHINVQCVNMLCKMFKKTSFLCHFGKIELSFLRFRVFLSPCNVSDDGPVYKILHPVNSGCVM